MPAWSAAIATAKRIPWKALFIAGQQLYVRGRKFRDNLSEAERSRLGGLLRKSKGRRTNLTDREVADLRDLVRKGITG